MGSRPVPRSKRARGRPVASSAPKFGVEQIVDAALQLLDEAGLDALSMRELAHRVGVRASALYWHIGDKGELYGLMAWRFYQGAIDAAGGSRSWEEWLRRFGQAFHGALCAHRDAAQLCAIARPRDQEPVSRGDYLAAPLVLLGLSRNNALVRMASVISLALGWAIYEQSETQRDYLARMIAIDTGFDTGLLALLGGFSLDDGNAKRPAVRQFTKSSARRRR